MSLFNRGPQRTTEPRLAFTCSDKDLRNEFVQRYRRLPSQPEVRVNGDSVSVDWITWAKLRGDMQDINWPRNLAGLKFTVVPMEPDFSKGQPTDDQPEPPAAA